MSAPAKPQYVVDFFDAASEMAKLLPDHTTRVAINTLLATHGHTLPVEHRAALRGWLGRIG
jgi:hypothetical protein